MSNPTKEAGKERSITTIKAAYIEVDKLIRSVSYKKLRDQLGDVAFSSLMQTKQVKDVEVETAIRAIVRRWKAGEISAAEKDALEAPIYAEYEAWALSVGVYENVQQEALDAEDDNEMVDFVKSISTTRLLNIVTRITNYFRKNQGKPPLTSNEVKTRLLA